MNAGDGAVVLAELGVSMMVGSSGLVAVVALGLRLPLRLVPPAISYSVLLRPYFAQTPLNIRSCWSARFFSLSIISLWSWVSPLMARL